MQTFLRIQVESYEYKMQDDVVERCRTEAWLSLVIDDETVEKVRDRIEEILQDAGLPVERHE